jgi:hypothetical protein
MALPAKKGAENDCHSDLLLSSTRVMMDGTGRAHELQRQTGFRACGRAQPALLALFMFGCSANKHASGTSDGPHPGPSSVGGGGPSLVVGSPGPAANLSVDGGGVSTSSGTNSFTGPLAGPFADFPASPLLDATDGGGASEPPTNAADLFGPASQGAATGGPCLIEPETGSLYPNNWVRPRFSWTTNDTAKHLFELRLHVNNQTNDLVVYTTQSQWTMPQAMWQALSAHSQDVPMTVSIRDGQLNGTTLSGEALGSTGSLGIAPVAAPGTIVYWAIVNGEGGTGVLKGFRIGDESVIDVLSGPQVQVNPAPTGNRACIGCHASTPDGSNVGFSSEWSGYSNSIATIGQDAGTAGGVPAFLTADARTALKSLNGVPAYSRGHWQPNDRITLLSDSGDLHWVNLEASGAQATGVIPRGPADSRAATNPAWSHDGSSIVYTSLPASGIVNGRGADGPMDLYKVHYNDKAGGDAAPLMGGADPSLEEYYPAFSADDRYVIFNTVPSGQNAYSNSQTELHIVPAAGGISIRLNANDPPACGRAKSPGATNSWAKWSPSAETVAVLGNTYYWIVFSSTRDPGGNPQLYVSPVVVDAQGNVTTYHSLYLWNQPAMEDNHTPAWDVFEIPQVPVPDVR